MKWEIVFGFLLAAATANENALKKATKSVQERSPTYDYNDYGPPMPYNFRYTVFNPLYHNNFGHEESSDGRVTTGSYFVALPDGRLQTVAYKDEGYGFMAQVHYDGEAKYPTGPVYPYGAQYLGQSVPKLSDAQVAALMKIMVDAVEQQTALEAGKEHHHGDVTVNPMELVTTTEAVNAANPIVPVEALQPVAPIVPVEAIEPAVTIANIDATEEAEPVPELAAELDLEEASDPPIYQPRQIYRDIYAKYRRPYAPASSYGPYDRYAKYRAPYTEDYESPYGPYDQYAKYRQYSYPGKYRQAYTTYDGKVYAARPKRKHPKRLRRRQQARRTKDGKVVAASIKRIDEEVEDYDDYSETEILKV